MKLRINGIPCRLVRKKGRNLVMMPSAPFWMPRILRWPFGLIDRLDRHNPWAWIPLEPRSPDHGTREKSEP